MANWVRRMNALGKQLRCGGCFGIIDLEEPYFQMQDGCRLCMDCGPPDDETTCDL